MTRRVRPAGSIVPVHVGRQPIYNADGSLHAYELLFRQEAGSMGSNRDDDSATTSVILTAFADFDPAVLLGDRPGFVNLSRAFVSGALPVPFAPELAVLEILESITVDAEIVLGVERLRDAGYRIALDDFVLTEQTAPLLQFADYIKVDLLATDWTEIARIVGQGRSAGAVMLAEKVEDAEALERCKLLGFELFQGYHLGRPQTMTSRRLNPSQLSAVQLLSALADPAVSLHQVEVLVSQDPALTYKLLRVANSAGSGANRTINSLREAVVMVGLTQLRAWVMLLAVTDIMAEGGAGTDALGAITVRARSCQLLAETVPGAHADVAFTLGILDGVAALLGLSGSDLLDQLPLEGELAAGLRGDRTPERAVLTAVLGHERYDLVPVLDHGFDVSGVSYARLEAIKWSQAQLAAQLEAA